MVVNMSRSFVAYLPFLAGKSLWRPDFCLSLHLGVNLRLFYPGRLLRRRMWPVCVAQSQEEALTPRQTQKTKSMVGYLKDDNLKIINAWKMSNGFPLLDGLQRRCHKPILPNFLFLTVQLPVVCCFFLSLFSFLLFEV